MKIRPDKNQVTWSITIFATAAAVLVFYCIFFRASAIAGGFRSFMKIMSPILYGIIISLIMSPMLNGIEQHWLKPHYRRKEHVADNVPLGQKSRKRMRKISVFITESILIMIFVVLILLIVPQTIRSIQDIADHITVYIDNANRAVNSLLGDGAQEDGWQITEEMKGVLLNIINHVTEWLNGFLTKTVLPNTSNIVVKISSGVLSLVRGFFNVIIGIIVSVYLLYSKETMAGQFKKMTYAIFRDHHANIIIGEFRYIQRTFVGYISGKILDSIIIGILCYIGTEIIGTPYPMLVSVFVGVTNVIPFFGPYIGAIFGLAIIVMINPLQALYFLIFVLILQQFDGNILGPKILGDSTGLSSFWVIFSILLFGGLWGVAGWIIGVPIFAVAYHWAVKLTERSLLRKGMPTDTHSYIEAAYIEYGEIHSMLDESDRRYKVEKIANPWKKLAFWSKKSSVPEPAVRNDVKGSDSDAGAD
ncbi:AI-2E family transporter [Lachnoclostridium sp. Marseille-P6806]|uniref:AI-2E family transporter n=1 Tax=Lachnoclostridium sp. Marseille-P6806 TaxID=2364793 RepID=UPI001030210F|nr:AI-2E family transporter [Lachnoclostridium sp. Marseille-P6806]